MLTSAKHMIYWLQVGSTKSTALIIMVTFYHGDNLEHDHILPLSAKGLACKFAGRWSPTPFLSFSRLKPSLLLLLRGRGQSHAPCSEHVKPLFVAQQFFTLRSRHFKSPSSAAITGLHHHPRIRVYDNISFIAKWCHHAPVTVKMDPPKLVPPGTINKDAPELALLQNMDSLWKIYKCMQTWNISLANFGPVAYVGGVVRLLRFLETTLAHQFSSTQCTGVSFPATCNTQLLRTLRKFCNKHMFWRLHGATEAYSWITVIHFSRYATVNSTNVLSSHWFSFMWLAYSENKLFRAGPNISENLFRGNQF